MMWQDWNMSECFKVFQKCFVWNYMCIRWLINFSDSTNYKVIHYVISSIHLSTFLKEYAYLNLNITFSLSLMLDMCFFSSYLVYVSVNSYKRDYINKCCTKQKQHYRGCNCSFFLPAGFPVCSIYHCNTHWTNHSESNNKEAEKCAEIPPSRDEHVSARCKFFDFHSPGTGES